MRSDLVRRTTTGILFVAVTVGCIMGGAVSFGALFFLITLLSVYEFCQLVNRYEKEVRTNTGLCVMGGGVLFLSFFLHETTPYVNGLLIPYLIILMGITVSELYGKRTNPVGNWAYSVLSQVYVALPFSLLNVLAFRTDDAGGMSTYYPILPLALLLFIWANDTGAYIIGVTFGKHRLFERISPKKSWEGSLGGAIFCLVAAVVIALFYPVLSMSKWIGFALTVVVFGTWGDLSESLMKRHWGIKDSGAILPGHGGMLDRFDSMLLAVPAVLLYLWAIAF